MKKSIINNLIIYKLHSTKQFTATNKEYINKY
jgi:hypothetical protein